MVERRLRGGNAGLSLVDLGLVVGGIDLNQEIAGPDALKILHGDGKNLTRNAAGEPRRLGLDVGIIRGLDHGVASAMNPNAISTATSGIASRRTAVPEPGCSGEVGALAVAGAAGDDVID